MLPVDFIRACGVLPSYPMRAVTQGREHLPPSLLHALSQFWPPAPWSRGGLDGCLFLKPLSFFPTLCCRAVTRCQRPPEGLCDVLLDFWVVSEPYLFFLVLPATPWWPLPILVEEKEAARFKPGWTVFLSWGDHDQTRSSDFVFSQPGIKLLSDSL